MKSAGKARNNGLYRHIRTSKEIIRNLLNDCIKNNIFAIEISSEKQDKVFGQAVIIRTCLRFSRGIFVCAALKNIPLRKGAVYSI